MSLLDRLKKNSKVKLSDALGKVKFVTRDEAVTHALPLNIALEGSFVGGIRPGVIQFAGPSRHFKSNIALIACRAWMDKYPEAVLLFYDSEGGSKMEMFNNAGIDTDRVLHTPIRNVEQLKFDMFNQLEDLSPDENIIIMIDSIGNLASKREVDNAENENSAADMTRAKELKSLWRIVTPYFQEKGVPCIVINHTYECGTGDMVVSTPNGPVKLSDMAKGDIVNTTEGPQEVQYTTKHEKAVVYDIELENGDVLSFTEGHRFMVDGEWKYVHDLKNGDILDVV